MKYATKKVENARKALGTTAALTVVLCGSFRRAPLRLQHDYQALLEAGCLVLSPHDLNFVGEIGGFVFSESECGEDPREIEAGHLEAMKEAHFLWLHAPDGYVGPSAAMELGYAKSLGLRIFASESPVDLVMASLVQVVPSAAAAAATVIQAPAHAPTSAITALQRYYRRSAVRRGWDKETALESLMLLAEEVRELDQALRESRGTPADTDEAALELADVQLYLVHLANILNVDLGSAVARKELINEERFQSHRALRAA